MVITMATIKPGEARLGREFGAGLTDRFERGFGVIAGKAGRFLPQQTYEFGPVIV